MSAHDSKAFQGHPGESPGCPNDEKESGLVCGYFDIKNLVRVHYTREIEGRFLQIDSVNFLQTESLSAQAIVGAVLDSINADWHELVEANLESAFEK